MLQHSIPTRGDRGFYTTLAMTGKSTWIQELLRPELPPNDDLNMESEEEGDFLAWTNKRVGQASSICLQKTSCTEKTA